MSAVAYTLLVLAFGFAFWGAAVALFGTGGSFAAGTAGAARARRAHTLVFGFLTGASAILTAAFIRNDFSLVYVAGHSELALPFFYRLTGFWAGQEGSLLFWAWSVSLGGLLFGRSRVRRRLSPATDRWFWSFFLLILAFFLLLLGAWSNPFLAYAAPPADGAGMNPMLQHPGMIFHPPLLFLGYGGFTVPACLGLAQMVAGEGQGAIRSMRRTSEGTGEVHWAAASRPFILAAWLFLSAGIILGGWWSYMEFGWGGYWAWDPVENASLVPWLVATAYLHTAVIENSRSKLGRVNVLLMALTMISALFATYIVRGNVVKSIHAFGDSAAGVPLLLFVLFLTAVSLWITIRGTRRGEALAGPFSREGLLLLVAWVMLTLAVVVLTATLWPVVSRLWSDAPQGFKPEFYNTSCLPFFVLLAAMLVFCPWLSWKGGIKDTGMMPVLLLLLLGTGFALFLLDIDRPVALAGAATAISIPASLVLLFGRNPSLRKLPRAVAAHGVHLGFALMVLGVSFSGPYKVEETLRLKSGQAYRLGEYVITLRGVTGGNSLEHGVGSLRREADGRAVMEPSYIWEEAELAVTRNGRDAGTLRPQIRIYAAMPGRPFTEAHTVFSLGTQLYASLMGLDRERVEVRVSLNPLVNWIWIGGFALCLFPFLGMRGRSREPDDNAAS